MTWSRNREEAQEGDVSPKSLRAARNFVKDLNAKLEAQPLRIRMTRRRP